MTPEQAKLVDLIGNLAVATDRLVDDCTGIVAMDLEGATSIDISSLVAVSGILDTILALPYEEKGAILGTGAKLQRALKAVFGDQEAEIARLQAILAKQAPVPVQTTPKRVISDDWIYPNSPFTMATFEARVNRICGCHGEKKCNCVSVFNQASSDLWYEHNSGEPRHA